MEKARMNIRLPQEIKAFIEYGASIMGMSLTDFLISSATEKAKHAIEDQKVFMSSRRDQEAFFEALMNPEEPNDRLKAAVVRYNEAIADSTDA